MNHLPSATMHVTSPAGGHKLDGHELGRRNKNTPTPLILLFNLTPL